jgi:alpha(1,3/1,4) fucosyltransferase
MSLPGQLELPEAGSHPSRDRPTIILEVMNGLNFDEFVRDVLTCNKVTEVFQVRRPHGGNSPDIIVFGPYGYDLPRPGRHLRVGYICENYIYDGPQCDFVFSVAEQKRSDIPSARIQWHGFDPQRLVKPADADVEQFLANKTRFCNFVYSNRVPYREEIFKRLSRYKRVDAPGTSMRNMGSIDEPAVCGESRWETKRRFLAQYKFTLALENEIFPGYQTEKLYDAMIANSLPVYVGNPHLSILFDPLSMICPLGIESSYWLDMIRDFGQFKWMECHGLGRWRQTARLRRHARLISRDIRHRWLVSKVIDALVGEMVELDRDDKRYLEKLRTPWFYRNEVPIESYSTLHWCNLFTLALERSCRHL